MVHPFEYQAPCPESVEHISSLRKKFIELHDEMISKAPNSAELTLAVRKLEEANMWLNKAFVMNQ